MVRLARWMAICAALGLAGCDMLQADAGSTGTTIRGVPNGVEVIDATRRVADQTKFLTQLFIVAGATDQAQPVAWHEVFLAGVDQIDAECDQYQRLLYEFHRKRTADRRGLVAIAAGTAAILGLTATPAAPIAITASAFGLAQDLFDARVDSVIFSAERTAVRNIIVQGRQRYIEGVLPAALISRPRVMIALRGYLMQCAPETIEANFNNAANGSRFAVTSPIVVDAQAAAAAVAPGLSLSQRAAVAVQGPAVRPEPTVVPVSSKAFGSVPEEGNITPGDVRIAQRALGIAATGGFGTGPANDTRSAIIEFERGMNMKNPAEWPNKDGTGRLTDRTYAELISLRAMPRIFANPFERAWLGNDVSRSGAAKLTQISPRRLATLWVKIRPAGGGPLATGDTLDAQVEIVRARIVKFREEQNIDPGKGGVLDSNLARALKLNED